MRNVPHYLEPADFVEMEKQDEESPNVWIGSLIIIWVSPQWEVMIWSYPLAVFLSHFYQLCDLALQLPNKYGDIWILVKSRFKIQLKIFDKRLKFFHVLASKPI